MRQNRLKSNRPPLAASQAPMRARDAKRTQAVGVLVCSLVGSQKEDKRGIPFPFCQPSWLSSRTEVVKQNCAFGKDYRLLWNEAKKNFQKIYI
jgi:hypothetical protein